MDLYQNERTKYDIPLSHLDHGYIKSCSDVRELEKIIKVLRSGYEGTYVELEKLAEERLETLKPESRILRKENPISTKHDLDKTEWQALSEDLQGWEEEMRDKHNQSHQLEKDTSSDHKLPPIRGKQKFVGSNPTANSNPNKRVKPREYKEWDKVDIDAELAKVDTDKQGKPSTVIKDKMGVSPSIYADDLTEEEKAFKAEQEKNKGNEAFRSGDYDEALLYYRRSLCVKELAAVYNNRAQAFIKLKKWTEACRDCESVLRMEPDNIKAYMRRAVARQGKQEYKQAKTDLQYVLTKEPGNKQAQVVLKEVEKALMDQKVKGRRMVIEEVEGSSDEEEGEMKDAESDAEVTVNGEINHVSGNGQMDKQSSQPEKAENVSDVKVTDSESSGEQANLSESAREQEELPSSDTGHVGGSDVRKSESETGNAVPVNTSERDTNDVKSDNLETNQEIENESKPHGNTTIRESYISADHAYVLKDNTTVTPKDETPKDEITDVSSNPGPLSAEPQLVTSSQSSAVKDAESAVTYTPPPPLPDDVSRLKDKATELYKAGQYSDALPKYQKAVDRLKAEGDTHQANLCVMYSNLAACHLKLGDCRGCIEDCSRALEINPVSIKPLLRRAAAYETKEKLREAYVDYRQVLLLDSSATAAQEGSTRCSQALRQQDGVRWREKLPKTSPVMAPSLNTLHQQQQQKHAAEPHSHTGSSRPKHQQHVTGTNSSGSGPETYKEPPAAPPKKTNTELGEEYKNEGNNFVKKGQFKDAIPCYSRCIEVCPENIAAYSNRALCYLKTGQPDLVIVDCNFVISKEPNHVKALFRRALALKEKCRYEESVCDMKTLLKVDTTNTAARKEFAVILRLKQESEQKLKEKKEEEQKQQQQKQQQQKQQQQQMKQQHKRPQHQQQQQKQKTRQRIKIQEVEGSSDEEDSKPSQPISSKKQSENTRDSNSCSSTAKSNDGNNGGGTKSRKNQKSTKTAPAAAPAEKPKTTPDLQKATPYEFMQAWTSLKGTGNIQLYMGLLQQVEPKALKTVISNKLDGDMLTTMVKCILLLAKQGAAAKALDYLKSLPSVPRFSMISMFMSTEDKKEVTTIINELKASLGDDFSKSDCQGIKKQYGLH